jgi:hypothetical protein
MLDRLCHKAGRAAEWIAATRQGVVKEILAYRTRV